MARVGRLPWQLELSSGGRVGGRWSPVRPGGSAPEITYAAVGGLGAGVTRGPVGLPVCAGITCAGPERVPVFRSPAVTPARHSGERH